jgi:alpha-L-fucosidase
VSKNGNLLLNVGPDSQGTIPLESRNTLKAVGEWMKVNSESIYGCEDADLPKPDWGYFTRKGNVQ